MPQHWSVRLNLANEYAGFFSDTDPPVPGVDIQDGQWCFWYDTDDPNLYIGRVHSSTLKLVEVSAI